MLDAGAELSPEVPEPVGATRLGVLVGGSSYIHARDQRVSFAVDLLDLDRNELRTIPVDFLAHGFTTHPTRPRLAALFEKRGPSACLVDLAEARLLQPLLATTGRAFYGHGAFSPDGTQLYAVEIRTDTHAGLITIRDTTTLRVLEELPTYGDNPHDCVLLDDEKTLVVTNGGGDLQSKRDPSVTFIDLTSRKLLERIILPDPKINAGHIAVTSRGDFALVSAPRDGLDEKTALGGLSLRSQKRRPERMKAPSAIVSRMVGESLSVAIHEPSRVVAATSPHGGLLTFWHLDRKKLLKSFDLESVRGVTLSLDQSTFIVTHGRGSRLFITTDTLELVAGSETTTGRFTGSHVYTWRPS
ncbi:DUF1513 domain-containing protein [Chondromyces crocatus]|uniref:Uncharacterized protein n=1 Tax=Chondromyces crocatus TaxID=52 RepID=A0A0K1ETT0_CHOCO|nr:DUF1513 domain-containing protein [Chondromyces crocatus]AKT44038.1 uncharacterized protein CMC5_082760 [Chondromyces crocatus]